MSRIRRCLAALRGKGCRHGLAVLFLAVVLWVAAAALPAGVAGLGAAMRAGEPGGSLDVRSAAKTFDAAYREMLDFSGPLPVNRGAYIDLNGLMARLMGQRFVNDCVKLNNGHLAGFGGHADIPESWPHLVALCRRQEAAGKTFLFVLAPGQVSPYEPLEPVGYTNYYNGAGDAMLSALRKNRVPVLDLRAEMHAAGIRHAEAFFVADLHWKPETGLWAFIRILDELARMGAVAPVDPMYTDAGNYQTEVYERWFLGSSGRRTGRYFAGVDDFSVITPRFDTHLAVEIPTRGLQSEGVYAQTALDWRRLQSKDSYTEDPYEMYGHGNTDLVRYRNRQAPLDQRVLWLDDSFGNVVTPYFSLVFKEVEDLDMRYYRGDFARLYDAFQPDVVVVLVNATGTLQENTTHDFFPDGQTAR